MTEALDNTPTNRVIAGFFWVFVRLAAISAAFISVWATSTGAYSAFGRTDTAFIWAVVAGAINVVGIVLMIRGAMLWAARRIARAALSVSIALVIMCTAIFFDQIGLRTILDVNKGAAQAAVAQQSTRGELIAAAEKRVARAERNQALALDGKQIAQAALQRESSTGFGDRSARAAQALQEANAAVARASADLRAAEDALREARKTTIAAPTGQAISAGQSQQTQDYTVIALSVLLEVVATFFPALFGLQIADRVRKGDDGLTNRERAALDQLPPSVGPAMRSYFKMRRGMEILMEAPDAREAQQQPAPMPQVPAPTSPPIREQVSDVNMAASVRAVGALRKAPHPVRQEADAARADERQEIIHTANQNPNVIEIATKSQRRPRGGQGMNRHEQKVRLAALRTLRSLAYEKGVSDEDFNRQFGNATTAEVVSYADRKELPSILVNATQSQKGKADDGAA